MAKSSDPEFFKEVLDALARRGSYAEPGEPPRRAAGGGWRYDVALSYAGEDRHLVNLVALELVKRDVRVFYDQLEEHELWGKNLVEYLQQVFKRWARLCIIFVSRHYKEKKWPRHELASALERAITENTEYILPLQLDDTELPGLATTIGYERMSGEEDAARIADLVLRKMGIPPRSDITTSVETASQPTPPEVVQPATHSERAVERHEPLSRRMLPQRAEFGFFALHAVAVPETSITPDRFRATFLDMSRGYAEYLHFAPAAEVHPDGYTRKYSVHRGQDTSTVTMAATCYRDGHVVTEGYVDTFLEGKNRFNPNWFIYEIQRHLQLAKEVIAADAQEVDLLVRLEHIDAFEWEVYRGRHEGETRPYAGYHRDIWRRVALASVPGRDPSTGRLANELCADAEDVLVEVARIFGMDELPEPYWDKDRLLSFAKSYPTR